ncbi:MAG TPA: 6-pyruvoyl tetrahydropterin synthase family protein, partial [Gemmatimonadales bacterium]|nr:6-pyruvoyl tetrahydropterin synthase family protein [Gemmatimonadales bacterium]
MQSDFKVSVSKDYLVFSSAHFITFKGHQCEPLHGHNYRVGVEVEGNIDGECLFVVDFSVLKKIVRKLVDQIDHKVLLPTLNPKLRIVTEGDTVSVYYFEKLTYTLPVGDCALLPIQNSTAEMMAQYLAEGVRRDLLAGGITNLTRLEIEVEES